MKIAIWWGRNETFSSERFKSIKGDFSDGENNYIFGCWVGFPPSPGFPIKVQDKEGQSASGVCNNFLTFLLRREIPGIWFWEIILLETVLC